MAKFNFVAVREGGHTVSSTLEAADRLTAINAISSQGLRLISLQEQYDRKKGSLSLIPKRGVKSDDLVMFTRQLSAMVSAGVPILRALNSMAQYASNPTFKKAIQDVSKRIEGGDSFADALNHYPSIFNDVYVNMVRAGEAAGILDDILKRLALQQEKNATIRKKIKSAMTYPMVLIFITIGAF